LFFLADQGHSPVFVVNYEIAGAMPIIALVMNFIENHQEYR
jgi:hypothetical protein